MDSVNKTLYIPLYGKALVSREGLFLHDPKAEEIWTKEGFPLKERCNVSCLPPAFSPRVPRCLPPCC